MNFDEENVLTQKWYAVTNDLIGGFAVANADKPCSALDHSAGEREIANFWSEQACRLVVAAHNGAVERAEKEPEDYRLLGWDEAKEVRSLLTLALVNGDQLVTYAGSLEGRLVTVLGMMISPDQARPLAILMTEAGWPGVLNASQLYQPMQDMKPPKVRKPKAGTVPKPVNPADRLILPDHIKKR